MSKHLALASGVTELFKMMATADVKAVRKRLKGLRKSPYLKDSRDQHKTHFRADVSIIGGGYAGTATTVSMMNTSPHFSTTEKIALTNLNIFERGIDNFAAGKAYGETASSGVRLNIPRIRVPDLDGTVSFDSWQERYAQDDFGCLDGSIGRSTYGRYLRYALEFANHAKNGICRLNKPKDRAGEIIDIDASSDNNPHGFVTLKFKDGSTHLTNVAVLATGFDEAKTPDFLKSIVDSDGYLDSPSGAKADVFYSHFSESNKPKVLVVGTGLSSYDAVFEMNRHGMANNVTCVSRHAYRHKTYIVGEGEEESMRGVRWEIEKSVEEDLASTIANDDFNKTQREAEVTKILQRISNHCENDEAIKPEVISQFLEQYLADLVSKVSAAGKTSRLIDLFRKHSSLITTSRIGVIGAIGVLVENLEADKKVEFKKGNIESITQNPTGGYDVKFHGKKTTEKYDCVINALGYETDITKMKNPLIQNLLQAGHIRPHVIIDKEGEGVHHETGMGIDVNNDGQAIGADGEVRPWLSAIGAVISGRTMVGHRAWQDYTYTDNGQKLGSLGPFSLNISGINKNVGAFSKVILTKAHKRYGEYLSTRLSNQLFLERPGDEPVDVFEGAARFHNIEKDVVEVGDIAKKQRRKIEKTAAKPIGVSDKVVSLENH